VAEVASLPLPKPPVELGDGLDSSGTKSLIQHILGVPERTTTSISHERVDGETCLLASVGPPPQRGGARVV
jgi:hypothetical protein